MKIFVSKKKLLREIESLQRVITRLRYADPALTIETLKRQLEDEKRTVEDQKLKIEKQRLEIELLHRIIKDNQARIDVLYGRNRRLRAYITARSAPPTRSPDQTPPDHSDTSL